MNESGLYKELGVLTKDKSRWKENIPYVSSLLDYESVKIQAKALWLLGEMGLEYPETVKDTVPAIASFCESMDPFLRERAVNALGRIGRADYHLVEPYWNDLFHFASDEEPKVRLSFIWASENIATNTPDLYEDHMYVFESLLHDADDKVRMEAPEIFRVLGKRRPEFVIPYIEQLQKVAEEVGDVYKCTFGCPVNEEGYGICSKTMMMLYPLMEAVRSGGDLTKVGGDGKYSKTVVCPDGCVIFKLTAKPLGNENFHTGGFWDYPDETQKR